MLHLLGLTAHAQPRLLDGLNVSRSADLAAGLATINRLYGREPAVVRAGTERAEYKLSTTYGFVRLRAGHMNSTVSLVRHNGREAYLIRQETKTFGRRREEEALLDTRGLFPYRYTRKILAGRDDSRLEYVHWDHLGRRLFLEKYELRDGRIVRQMRREERRLGKDIPADVMDPLSALLAWRLRSIAAARPVDWKVTALTGCDETFAMRFRPRARASNAPPILTDWTWRAREPGVADHALRLSLDLSRGALPTRYAGAGWGVDGVLELVRHEFARD